MLSDCCIARFTEIVKRGRTRSSSVGIDFADTLIPLGALAYMSPEQVRGDSVDCRTDIFSFGVVLYEMLSGHHPFAARSSLSQISSILEAEPAPLSSRQTSIPPQLEWITRRTLAKSRENRYPSMAELLADLDAVRHRIPQQGSPGTLPSGIRKWLSQAFHRSFK